MTSNPAKKTRSTIPAAIALLCAASAAAPPASAAGPEGFKLPGVLVETDWLDENQIEPELLVVDIRPRERYDTGHIPNAVHMDDKKLLPLETPKGAADAAAVKSVLEASGIGDGVRVVIVDEVGGPSAAFLWWLLGYHGFDAVSVLNGGQTKWELEGRASTREAGFVRTATFTSKLRPEWIATLDQMKTWKDQPESVILDARLPLLYAGAGGPRAGHIPGAESMPWKDDMNHGQGPPGFKPMDDLASEFRKAGVGPKSRVAIYSKYAEQAAHVALAMAASGVGGQAAVYVGSIGEWASHPELEVDKSDRPLPGNARGKPGASSNP